MAGATKLIQKIFQCFEYTHTSIARDQVHSSTSRQFGSASSRFRCAYPTVCIYYSTGLGTLMSGVVDSMTGSVAISMTYGVDIRPTNDPNLQIAKLASAAVVECLTTGSILVDMFPLMKHLPAWAPGAGFQTTAKTARQRAEQLRAGIYSEGRQKMVISWFRIYIALGI